MCELDKLDMKARLLALVLATLGAPVHAQTWQPQRHVEISSPGGAGGALDTTARITEKLMQEMKLLPVSSAVVNRSGGEHAMAYNHIRQRTGDPHQLSFASPVLLANHWDVAFKGSGETRKFMEAEYADFKRA